MNEVWNKNDAVLVRFGGNYYLRRVRFLTEGGQPVVRLYGYHIPGGPSQSDWHKVGMFRRTWWGWKLND